MAGGARLRCLNEVAATGERWTTVVRRRLSASEWELEWPACWQTSCWQANTQKAECRNTAQKEKGKEKRMLG